MSDIDKDFEYLRLGHVTNGKRRCVADGFAWPCQTMRSLDRIEARESRLREALERIAEGLTPCRVCGEVHIQRPDPRFPAEGSRQQGVTWADPGDGHFFDRLGAEEVARRALTETTKEVTPQT